MWQVYRIKEAPKQYQMALDSACARYDELLDKCLDDTLSADEAEELDMLEDLGKSIENILDMLKHINDYYAH